MNGDFVASLKVDQSINEVGKLSVIDYVSIMLS
jgi:hypothetical protein